MKENKKVLIYAVLFAATVTVGQIAGFIDYFSNGGELSIQFQYISVLINFVAAVLLMLLGRAVEIKFPATVIKIIAVLVFAASVFVLCYLLAGNTITA